MVGLVLGQSGCAEGFNFLCVVVEIVSSESVAEEPIDRNRKPATKRNCSDGAHFRA
jgi:hypothetical protein